MTYASHLVNMRFQKPVKGLAKLWTSLGLMPRPKISAEDFDQFCGKLHSGLAQAHQFSTPITQEGKTATLLSGEDVSFESAKSDWDNVAFATVSMISDKVDWCKIQDNLRATLSMNANEIHVAGFIRAPFDRDVSKASNAEFARDRQNEIIGTLSL